MYTLTSSPSSTAKIRELWKKTRYGPSDLRFPNSHRVPQVLVDWSHSYSRTVVKESPKSGGEHGALTEVTNGNVNPGIHLNVNECESFLFVVLCFLSAIKLPNETHWLWILPCSSYN